MLDAVEVVEHLEGIIGFGIVRRRQIGEELEERIAVIAQMRRHGDDGIDAYDERRLVLIVLVGAPLEHRARKRRFHHLSQILAGRGLHLFGGFLRIRRAVRFFAVFHHFVGHLLPLYAAGCYRRMYFSCSIFF